MYTIIMTKIGKEQPGKKGGGNLVLEMQTHASTAQQRGYYISFFPVVCR